MVSLTGRQRDILEYLEQYGADRGYPPTIREIRDAFRLRSNRGVVDHLRALERKGFIRRDPGSSRAIEILAGAGGEQATPSRDSERETRLYPVLGQVPAGSPAPALEETERSVALDESLFGEKGDFLLEVRGDSMIGAHIVPGDLIVVQRNGVCDSGDIVVALVEGEATVKRFMRRNGGAYLEPANPRYRPIALRDEGCSLIGKVVGVIRRHPGRAATF